MVCGGGGGCGGCESWGGADTKRAQQNGVDGRPGIAGQRATCAFQYPERGLLDPVLARSAASAQRADPGAYDGDGSTRSNSRLGFQLINSHGLQPVRPDFLLGAGEARGLPVISSRCR